MPDQNRRRINFAERFPGKNLHMPNTVGGTGVVGVDSEALTVDFCSLFKGIFCRSRAEKTVSESRNESCLT